MKGKSAAKASQPVAATAEDIASAMDALSTADLVRLKNYAENRIYRIGPWAANRRTDEDLLNEAVMRLLDGTRQWFPGKVGIVTCLLGVIRSIASAWAGHRKRNPLSADYAALESEKTTKDDEGNQVSPFDTFASQTPNVEEQIVDAEIEAERKALANEIEKACDNDDEATSVILGWQSDMDGPAIQKEFGWTETEYRTIARRIQRRAHKIAEGHYGR